jgi:hypothetical protein
MVVLVAMNIFFSVQYTEGVRTENAQAAQQEIETQERLKTSRFMKMFVDTVLGTNGVISFEDRVKLESDVRALGDANVTEAWETFVASQTPEEAQANAVKLMSLLSSKMI